MIRTVRQPLLVVLLMATCGVAASACSTASGGARPMTPPPSEDVQRSASIVHPAVTGSEESAVRAASHVSARAMKVSEPGHFVVAVLADLNSSYGSKSYGSDVHAGVAWLTDELRPDLVISAGDMVAGQRRGLDYEAMWSAFHRTVSAPLLRAGIPFAVTPGNHDASAASAFSQERAEYRDQWKPRKPDLAFVEDGHYPFHYAFVERGVLFVGLDATTVGPLDDAQIRWLRGVLEAHRDVRATIVFGHVPLHPFTRGREMETLSDERLENLFTEFGVDAMVSGHHHAYFPGRRGALRLVSAACLGSGPRPLVGTDFAAPRGITVLEISPEGDMAVETFRSPDFASPIPRRRLPRELNSGGKIIVRDDVAPPQRKTATRD